MLSKQPGVWGSIARQAAGCVSIEQAAGCGTPIHRSSDPPTQPCPMCRRSPCSSVGPRSLVLSPPRSTGFSLAFLSPCPTPPCCCLLPCPFVPRPSKELIRGRREGGSLCAVGCCGSLPDPICPPPPPVTHQALCPRRGSKGHLHTCRAVQRERGCCASVPVPYSCLAETFTGRFLPARRCQPYFDA